MISAWPKPGHPQGYCAQQSVASVFIHSNPHPTLPSFSLTPNTEIEKQTQSLPSINWKMCGRTLSRRAQWELQTQITSPGLGWQVCLQSCGDKRYWDNVQDAPWLVLELTLVRSQDMSLLTKVGPPRRLLREQWTGVSAQGSTEENRVKVPKFLPEKLGSYPEDWGDTGGF